MAAVIFILIPRGRLPRQLADIGSAIAIGGLLVWGVARADLLPMLLAVGLALSEFGVRFPLISDGGGRRSEAFPRGYRMFAEPARYVTGLLASRWPAGELELDGGSVRFVTTDGAELFEFPVSAIERHSSKTGGRGDLRFETTSGHHTIAFGRDQLRRGEAYTAVRFWVSTILDRQDEGAGAPDPGPSQEDARTS